MFWNDNENKTPAQPVETSPESQATDASRGLAGIILATNAELPATDPTGGGSGGTGNNAADGGATAGGMGQDAKTRPALAGQGGNQDGVETLNQESLEDIISLGFEAIDETLRDTLRDGWLARTGDKAMAEDLADAARPRPAVKHSVVKFGAAVAKKYRAGGEFTPEIGLAVALLGYGMGQWTAFKALKQAGPKAAKN